MIQPVEGVILGLVWIIIQPLNQLNQLNRGAGKAMIAIANYLPILAILGSLLGGLLWSLSRMSTALDEADLGGFVIWTCVASVFAGLPSWL